MFVKAELWNIQKIVNLANYDGIKLESYKTRENDPGFFYHEISVISGNTEEPLFRFLDVQFDQAKRTYDKLCDIFRNGDNVSDKDDLNIEDYNPFPDTEEETSIQPDE